MPQRRLAVADLICAAHDAAYPTDPPLILEKEASRLIHELPDEANAHVVIWEGETAVAWGVLNSSLTENLHVMHARLLVRPEVRRQGLGRELARVLGTQATALGRRLVTFTTAERDPSGEPFARMLGAEAALPIRYSQLVLNDVSPELLHAWIARPEGDPYVLHFWEVIPEAFLTRMAEVVMVINTAPRGTLEVDDSMVTPTILRHWERQLAENGGRRLTAVIEDTRTGELVGYTGIYWHPERDTLVHQGATAVRLEARGAGLGKWLKAAVLQQLPTLTPNARFVRTNNAEENAAMLGINVTLGFTAWDRVTQWQQRVT